MFEKLTHILQHRCNNTWYLTEDLLFKTCNWDSKNHLHLTDFLIQHLLGLKLSRVTFKT